MQYSTLFHAFIYFVNLRPQLRTALIPNDLYYMANKYKEYQQLNLPAISQEVLAKWEADRAFEKSVELREGSTPFVFY